MLEVTQEDREAAAQVARMQSRYAKAANMKVGNCDTSPLVQLMARHRTTALAAKEAENAELRAKVEKLREALGKLISACDEGRVIPRGGACGMTIEAQIRASVINGVPAWSVEEAREALERATLAETQP